MDVRTLIPGIVGAFVGVVGWLLVGLYIQHQQFMRQARNAARAVYFELELNRLNVQVAVDYSTYVPLARSMFDRLLPELATWLHDVDLQTVVTAYMGHIGYEQARSDPGLPETARRGMLAGILAEQEQALQLLRRRLFSPEQVRRLEKAKVSAGEATTSSNG
jgi:hypothetical protein